MQLYNENKKGCNSRVAIVEKYHTHSDTLIFRFTVVRCPVNRANQTLRLSEVPTTILQLVFKSPSLNEKHMKQLTL